MCGIAGILTPDPQVSAVLARAEAVQRHRGPDAQATACYRVGDWTVGFAHQRLAILDLSEAGAQPMASPNGDVLIYNGEVYNYQELRAELCAAGHRFKSQSDTEVVLAALGHWGLEEALTRANGMWALAWLERRASRLHLARDRAGIKPLYYLQHARTLMFASEIKTLLEMSPGRLPLNVPVIGAFLSQSLLDASAETMIDGVYQLAAGHTLSLDLTQAAPPLAPRRYWTLPTVPPDDVPAPDAPELAAQLRALFLDAVALRLRSDVPVGVLLSGGVDSSAIVCAAQHLLGAGAELELIGAVSSDPRFDESPFIDEVARFVGRGVHKVKLEFAPHEALDLLGRAIYANDQPVAGFSSVAHYLLMERARERGVTVVLSGQGADELLCGYRKYLGFYVQALVREGRYAQAAGLARRFVARGTVVNQFSLSEARRYLPGYLAGYFERPSTPDWRGPCLRELPATSLGLGPGMSVSERQALDVTRLSVPALNHYEDRMSMAFGREVRLPFLDVRLMELLCPLPAHYKLRNGWTKYLFRRALASLMPPTIVWRKDKQGFSNPQSEWLKRELRAEVLALFAPDAHIFRTGLVDRAALLKTYEAYCEQPHGRGAIWYRDIFNPLATELWLRKFEGYLS